MKTEIMEKINAGQKYITTNDELSGYGYVKEWRKDAKTQKWRLKKINAKWKKSHPEQVKALNAEHGRKGGKYYAKHLLFQTTGITGARNKIRMKNRRLYKHQKAILTAKGFDVVIHDQWIDNTAERSGVAFVDRVKHQHGVIEVIQPLLGEITLFQESRNALSQTKNKSTLKKALFSYAKAKRCP